MCERVKTALDIIKTQPNNGGVSEAALMLFDKVCEDNEKMGQRMTELEKKFDNLDKKMDRVLAVLDRPTFGKVLKEIITNKVFIYILVTIFTALCGASVSKVGLELLK